MDIFSILAIAVMLVAVVVGFMRRFSYTNVLVVANLIVFMLTLLAPVTPFSGGLTAVQTDLGFRATYFSNGQNLYTVFTNLFIHASFFHVIGNMLFLFLIGNSYEERVGKNKFVATYFIAGLAGTLVESVLLNGSSTLLIGASGAIAGVMGAMLLLYPRDKVPMFLLIIFLPAVSVWLAVGSWFAWQVFLAFSTPNALVGGGIGFGAHFGGFLAGMLVAHLYPQSLAKTPRAVDVTGLESLATTKELKDALDRIRGETNPDIRNAWLEYFAEHAVCPKCGNHPKWKANSLKCTCGFESQLK
ncbi:MAG: rhomboid family intramembrane serine protease [Methanomassiliicoccales archaeon]|jgi:membrane associated rhomboid family serine protease